MSLAQMRVELTTLQSRARALRREIDEREQAAKRAGLTGLGPHQRTVLLHLAADYCTEQEWGAWPFKQLARETGLNREQVRRACRSLRGFGLVRHELSLWTDDGEPIGAGYRATVHGVEYAKGLLAAASAGECLGEPQGNSGRPK